MKTTFIGMLLSPLLLLGQQNVGTWSNIGSSPAAVQAIAVDPRGTGTIFMGTIGRVISLFDTGEGQTSPQGVDGKTATAPYPKPRLPVSVTIADWPDTQTISGDRPTGRSPLWPEMAIEAGK